MTKCLVVFFSQGGTTRRIAESIAKGIRSGDIDVNLFNIKDGQLPDLKKYDVLGIGSPTYYFRPPFIVSDCLDNLPDLSGKKVFTFILHGTYPGDAGNRVRRALKNKGGSEIGYSRYYGADYFLGYVKQGYLFSPDQPKPEKIGEAEQFGRELAARVAGKPYTQQDYDPAPAVIYRLQRVLLSRFLIRHQYSRLFGADKKACSACGLCMKLCPTQNIRADVSGRPVWGRNCMLCFSCEMKCPKDAIKAPVTWFLFWPSMFYNTRKAAHDPSIAFARVTHRSGKTNIL